VWLPWTWKVFGMLPVTRTTVPFDFGVPSPQSIVVGEVELVKSAAVALGLPSVKVTSVVLGWVVSDSWGTGRVGLSAASWAHACPVAWPLRPPLWATVTVKV
jgi:hypothetical protein